MGLQSLEGTLHCTDPASENLMGHTFPIVRILVNDSFEKCIPIYCQSYVRFFHRLTHINSLVDEIAKFERSHPTSCFVSPLPSPNLRIFPHFSTVLHSSGLLIPSGDTKAATPSAPRGTVAAFGKAVLGRGKGGKAAGRGLGAEAGAGDSSEVP